MRFYNYFLIILLLGYGCFSQADDNNGCSDGRCSCSLGLNTVAFGNFNTLNNTSLGVPVNLSVTCVLYRGRNTTVTYSVTFTAGFGTISLRHMNGSSSNTLNYNLYADSNYSQILGSGVGGTSKFSKTFTLGSGGCNSPCVNNHTIYAQIPVQPLAISDNTYHDALTVALIY